ncbi:transposase-like protein [Paraburkholderia sp. Clong3]
MKARSISTRAPAAADNAGEDKELTAFLSARINALLSPRHDPRPDCPRCGGDHINSAGFRTRQTRRMPVFDCQTCGRQFSRTVGTPLCEKHLKKLDVFVSLLSQPVSCVEAGHRMGSLPDDIKERVTAFRLWLRELDPGGEWERRVRLGGRPTEVDPAPLVFDEIGVCEDLKLTRCPDARIRRAEFDQSPATSVPGLRQPKNPLLRTSERRLSTLLMPCLQTEIHPAPRYTVREHENGYTRAHAGVHPVSVATAVGHAGVGNRRYQSRNDPEMAQHVR